MAEHHDDVRFEPRDVTIRPIVLFLVVLAVLMVGAMGGLWLMQEHFLAVEHIAKQPARPLVATLSDEQRLPPEPRIEGIGGEKASHSVTNQDIPTSAKNQRAREEQMLNEGWTDAGGRRHPPIAEAIQQITGGAKR